MHLYQPVNGQFGKLLTKELGKKSFKKYCRLTIVVAYAKHSGVSRLATALESFKNAGGDLVAVVGLDQRHTTVEALRMLRDLGAKVYIFFDENNYRTFHPKIYWLTDTSAKQWVAIGSNNLTAGGLYLNYEMTAIYTDPVGSTVGDGLAASLSVLADPTSPSNANHLRELTDSLLNDLIGRGYILTEQQVKERDGLTTKGMGNGLPKKKPLFGSSKAPKIPAIPAKFKLKLKSKVAKGSTPQKVSGGSVVSDVGAPAYGSAKGFWKKLSAWDVSKTSSPGQMIIPLELAPLFPKLGRDKPMASGGTQADTNFNVEYKQTGHAAVLVNGARLIAYSPAPGHKRKNVDLRFTFLDKSVAKTLKQGDVLRFVQTGISDPAFVITRVAAASVATGKKRFGLIP